MCPWHVQNGQLASLRTADRLAIAMDNEYMAGEALRVLGFAYKKPLWLMMAPAGEKTQCDGRRHDTCASSAAPPAAAVQAPVGACATRC